MVHYTRLSLFSTVVLILNKLMVVVCFLYRVSLLYITSLAYLVVDFKLWGDGREHLYYVFRRVSTCAMCSSSCMTFSARRCKGAEPEATGGGLSGLSSSLTSSATILSTPAPGCGGRERTHRAVHGAESRHRFGSVLEAKLSFNYGSATSETLECVVREACRITSSFPKLPPTQLSSAFAFLKILLHHFACYVFASDHSASQLRPPQLRQTLLNTPVNKNNSRTSAERSIFIHRPSVRS